MEKAKKPRKSRPNRIKNPPKPLPIDRPEGKKENRLKSFYKRFRETYTEAGLDFPKEMLKTIAFSLFPVLASLFLSYFLSLYWLLIPGCVLGMVFAFLLLTRPSQERERKRRVLQEEFVDLFSFFRLFLSNGRSVYHALEECRAYASKEMCTHLEKLLRQIDCDKSVAPYLEFAKTLGSIPVRQAMIAIYELSLDGGKERLAHFETLFSRLSLEKREERYDHYLKRIGNLNLLPLLSGGFAMILVAFAVISIMGSVGYGI